MNPEPILLSYLKSKGLTNLTHCRFCAKCISYDDLLDLSSDRETLEQYFHIIEFLKLDFVDLSEKSKLPKTTCETCYNSLQGAYNFLIDVKKSQMVLDDIYNTINSDLSNEDIQVKLEKDISEYALVNLLEKKFESNISEIVNMPAREKDNDKIKQEKNKAASLSINTDSSSTYTETDELMKESEILQTDVPIINKSKITKLIKRKSWSDYKWICCHCRKVFKSMDELRNHSKECHDSCYAYKCVDCIKEFNMFNTFIEHVRQHRNNLRLFCQICNDRFDTPEMCTEHAAAHWQGEQQICDLCGEIFQNAIDLQRHKNVYKKRGLPRHYFNIKPKLVLPEFVYHKYGNEVFKIEKSWREYEWTCQDCNMRVSDVETLRQHVRDIHNKCFSMKCVDCLRVMRHFRFFVSHVVKHRPYLKNYCQYCNLRILEESDMSQHISEHVNGSQKPCEGCGQTFENNDLVSQHMKQYDSPRRSNHLTADDLTCDVCFKFFPKLQAFRRHRLLHLHRERDYTCVTCGKGFYSKARLVEHAAIHDSRKEVCQICKKAFSTKPRLRFHVMTHSEERPFICDECGKSFKTKRRLKCHIMSHMDMFRFKCFVCDKGFRTNSGLKTHSNQHTGLKPYACEVCEKTFGNWANCNKHMIRKHGITLARSKITARGKVEINRRTGQPKYIESDEKAKEWMYQITATKGRKKTAE